MHRDTAQSADDSQRNGLLSLNDRAPLVFANGIWKSGNHLLLKLCSRLGYRVKDPGVAASLLLGDWYLLRRLIRGPRWARTPVNVGLEVSTNISGIWLARLLRLRRQHALGGHAAFSEQLLDALEAHGARPIQIVRDPRDVVVSFAHWIDSRPDYYAYPYYKGLSLEERMMRLIRGGAGGSMYLDSLATVLDRSYGWLTSPGRVLVVRFEDLVGQEGGGSAMAQTQAIDSILEWVGVKTDTAVLKSSLFGGTKTFRSGKIGGWQNEFTGKVEKEFYRVVGDRLAMWGYAE